MQSLTHLVTHAHGLSMHVAFVLAYNERVAPGLAHTCVNSVEQAALVAGRCSSSSHSKRMHGHSPRRHDQQGSKLPATRPYCVSTAANRHHF